MFLYSTTSSCFMYVDYLSSVEPVFLLVAEEEEEEEEAKPETFAWKQWVPAMR